MGNADFFGHIASSQNERGMFGVFYDLSPKSSNLDIESLPLNSFPGSPSSKDNPDLPKPKPVGCESSRLPCCILVTTVSGDGLVIYDKMSDSEIVERCVDVLRRMFPHDQIPVPLGSMVSRWGADPFAQMSYSYAAVGSSGEDYDSMAEDIEGRIFFAGEVTGVALRSKFVIIW